MKFRHRLPLGLVLLLLSLGGSDLGRASQATLEQRFQAANEQYVTGNYQEAIGSYRQIIARHGYSAEILHNLANSYAGAGQYGQAILHYLRGLHLAPGDADLQGDLAAVREKRGIFAQEQGAAQRLFGLLDMNQWTLLAFGGYVALTILLLVHLRFPLGRMLAPMAVLLLSLTALSLHGVQKRQAAWYAGVVIKPDTRMLVSPFAAAASLGDIDEGSVIRCGKQHGAYCHVGDDKGRTGWIASSAFEPVVTSVARYSRDDAER